MKKMIAWVLLVAALVSLTACGGKETAKSADLTALYEEMTGTLPEMVLLDEMTMLNFLGIDAESCVQVVVATCADGLITDEVWLIEAKDEASLEQIKQLAQNRVKAKGEESISYSPEQYAVVEKHQLLTEGNYLALLVSPDVDTLKASFQAAFK